MIAGRMKKSPLHAGFTLLELLVVVVALVILLLVVFFMRSGS
jgi:prepilin-type N-terminal cleavage/methylation domain-containing protein